MEMPGNVVVDKEVAKTLIKYMVQVAAEKHYFAAKRDLAWAFAHLTADQQDQYIQAVQEMEDEEYGRSQKMDNNETSSATPDPSLSVRVGKDAN